MLTSARKQLWKFRFMLYWRSAAIPVVFVFIVAWVISPMFLGVYLGKLPFTPYTPLKYVGWVCLPMFVLNLLLADSKDNLACVVLKNLTENWSTLSLLIRSTKNAIRLLKRMRVEKLNIYDLDDLRTCLEDIGVDAGAVSV